MHKIINDLTDVLESVQEIQGKTEDLAATATELPLATVDDVSSLAMDIESQTTELQDAVEDLRILVSDLLELWAQSFPPELPLDENVGENQPPQQG